MSRFVFVTWNGGGNLTPALGIARVLAEHSYTIDFLGEESQRQRVVAAGLAFTAYAQQTSRKGEAPATPLERQRQLLSDIWMNDALADAVPALLRQTPADMVVVDCMLAGVLAHSADFGAPTTVLVHSLYAPVLPMRDALVTLGNRLRAQAGRAPLDPASMQWEHKDLILVTTLREFDGNTDPAANVQYVGPVFEPPAVADWPFPWDSSDARPLVVASLSTMPGQTSPAGLQLVLDAVASLPLRLLLSTGPVPCELVTPPANARVYRYVPHMAVLPHAALAINHAGHGSVMAALANGVPLVCLPGLGADQSLIATRVAALGAGRVVPSQATADELRSAVEEVLATSAYRDASERLAALIRREDGATSAARILETYAAA